MIQNKRLYLRLLTTGFCGGSWRPILKDMVAQISLRLSTTQDGKISTKRRKSKIARTCTTGLKTSGLMPMRFTQAQVKRRTVSPSSYHKLNNNNSSDLIC